MSSPFQRKFSSNSPLHGAYESAADSSRYISNAKDFQKLQDTIVKTGLAAKDRVDQIKEWESEANSMDWDSVNVYGADGTTVIGKRLTAKGKLNQAHHRKYGPGKKSDAINNGFINPSANKGKSFEEKEGQNKNNSLSPKPPVKPKTEAKNPGTPDSINSENNAYVGRSPRFVTFQN
tara:strand:+ start:6664 stop:7194 length:531 start_codon:yes stop_codon:yes gene_type:complete